MLLFSKDLPRRILIKERLYLQKCYTSSVKLDEEYTSTPQYPPILDTSYEAKKEREKKALYEEIQKVPTVEEKQIKLNMPKYYGFKCYKLFEDRAVYNTLPFIQHVTKTHLIVSSNLPIYYDNINVDTIIDNIKPEIEELILTEYDGYIRRNYVDNRELSSKELEDTFSSSLATQLNRFLLNVLNKSSPHVKNLQVDFSPRIESFWFAGGMSPPEYIKKNRRKHKFFKQFENEPTDRGIYSFTYPCLTLRADQPLKPIIPLSEAENPDLYVPYFKYDPRTLHTPSEYRRIANVPGFWPGEKYQFGVLAYHKRGYILQRNYGDESESKETLHRQGILASFSWLNAQANFLGFTTFNDITYPLVTQTCITNGQIWSFYVYQLNTMLMHSKNIKENPKRNICWAITEMKLFDDIKDNKVHGLNTDVLKMILKLYLNQPEERLGVNLRPYLNVNEKYAADYADDEKRRWLEKEFKFLTSNRPRSKLPPEVYDWEKIYKIFNKTRPMDKRTRPFELFVKPFNRPLDDVVKKYIPKSHRPHLPKKVGRYEKTFYP